MRALIARSSGALLVVVEFAAIIVALALGAFRTIDDDISDLRFNAQARPTTGSVVFVDIDPRSLESVGVWPWPRHIHAQVLDTLMALGAGDVVFDIDFSVASSEAEDDTFAKSLEAAGGYAFLAAFQQQKTGAGPATFNMPEPRFRKFADPVAVNVSLDGGGVVRTYPFAMALGNATLPSAASLLSGVNGPAGGGFDIDYSIDPSRVDRISVADLLAGKVDAKRIEGKQVIIGASAVELRDYFVVPRYGILPGALLQVLATETLKQGRALQPAPAWPGMVVVGAIGLAVLFGRRRVLLPLAIPAAVLVSAIAEGAALVLELRYGLMLDTAAIHLAAITFVLAALIGELVKRGQLKRAADERLRYLSRHDPLTGALSRLALTELIRQSAGKTIGVVLVDLRRFRIINDTLGHSQGDLLLKQVVTRLQSMGPDAVARLGGDSFALLVPNMGADRLQGFCETVAQWVAFPYQLADGHQAIIAASAGATTSAISGDDPDMLLSHADMALSAAKQIPGNGVALFAPEMDNRLKDRTAMDAALRRGLAQKQFYLAYQPQIELKTSLMVGVEALARWSHPKLGSVPPTKFIPAAEETGLIVELGRWVLATACRDAVAWPNTFKVAVNVSPVQFELSDIVADVKAALVASNLPPGRLEIEITEGIFVKNFEAVAKRLVALRSLGVGIALDDFGTGYSSLSYLGQLPVDKIKIDQSFVRRLPNDAEAKAIVSAVVMLARSLGTTIIAEGIETPEQAKMLSALGCTLAQGFYLGRPMPALEINGRIADAPLRLAAAG